MSASPFHCALQDVFLPDLMNRRHIHTTAVCRPVVTYTEVKDFCVHAVHQDISRACLTNVVQPKVVGFSLEMACYEYDTVCLGKF